MSVAATPALTLVQRCVRAKQQSNDAALPGYCNTLTTHERRCVLDIEPLSQFDFAKAQLPAVRQDILQRYHGGKQEEMDWLWGKGVLANAPCRGDAGFAPIAKVGCGLTCFTMVLRYLRAKGESETFYDRAVKNLKAEHRPARARRKKGSNAWVADWGNWAVPPHWYPAHVLWWMRQQYGITKDTQEAPGKWSWWRDYPMLTPRGILWIEKWADFAKREARQAESEQLRQAAKQSMFPPIQEVSQAARKLAATQVPRAVRALGLEMPEWGLMSWGSAKARNRVHVQLKKALDDGYPVIVLFPGHFSLIIGYLEEEARVRRGGKLATRWNRRYVVNNPGEGRLQHCIDRDAPDAKYKWSKYFILKLGGGKQVDKRTLDFHPKRVGAAGTGSAGPAATAPEAGGSES